MATAKSSSSRRSKLLAVALCAAWMTAVTVVLWNAVREIESQYPSGHDAHAPDEDRRNAGRSIKEYWITIDDLIAKERPPVLGRRVLRPKEPPGTDYTAATAAPPRDGRPPGQYDDDGGGGSTNSSDEPALGARRGGRAGRTPAPPCSTSTARCGDAACAALDFADLDSPPPEPACATPSSAPTAAAAAAADDGATSLALIIVLRDEPDSVPVQTYLSAHAYTPARALREIVLAHVDGGTAGERWRATAGRLLREHRAADCAHELAAGRTLFEAVAAAVERTRSRYVAVVDDSVVLAAGWAEPLLAAASRGARAIFLPHVDALLPSLVYSRRYQAQAYSEPQSSAWSVAWSLRYRERAVSRAAAVAAEWVPSAALPRDAFLASRAFLVEATRRALTRSVLELGYLAWTCGDGVFLVGCSTVQKASNYFHAAAYDDEEQREAFAAAHMSHYAALYRASRQRTSPATAAAPAAASGGLGADCKDFRWYAEQVAFLPLAKLSAPEIERIEQLGQLMSMQSGRCFRFGDPDSSSTIQVTELDNCLTDAASTVYVERDSGGLLRNAADGAGISCSPEGALSFRRADRPSEADGLLSLVSGGLISNGHCCLVRRETSAAGGAAALTANCSSRGVAEREKPGASWTWAIVP